MKAIIQDMALNFLAAALLLVPAYQARAQRLPWHSDYKLALKEARSSGRPLLVSFRCVP